jgi:hypothetical protein
MRRARLAAVLLLLSPSACSALLGYDSGTLATADGGGGDASMDGPGDTHAGDGPLPDSAREGSADGPATQDGADGPFTMDGPPADAGLDVPLMPDTLPRDSPPADTSPPVDAPADVPPDVPAGGDAGITCNGCPGATTYFVEPAASGLLTGIALDGANVYYALATAADGTIIASPKTDGTMRTFLVTGAGNHVIAPAGVATDGTKVYWANSMGAGGVYFCPTSGACTPAADQTPGPVLGLAIDTATGERYLGFTNGAVDQCAAPMTCNAVGGSPPQAAVFGIAVGTQTFFWGYAEGATSNLWAAPETSISLDQSILLDTGELIVGMALSSSMMLYWVTEGGALKKCQATNNPSCSAAIPIATGLGNPGGVAVDATDLYVTVNEASGHGIFKMPLP